MAMLALISEADMTPVAKELDTWNGGETMVNIPVRARPLVADIFAAVLVAMVGGSVVAGVLLRCLPKLLLHRAALRASGVGGSVTVIRRRCDLLLGGQVAELFARIRLERSTPARVSGKRPRLSASSSVMPSVRALARAGAFSKAIKRITSSIADFDAETAKRWAATLIPNPPAESSTLGASPISEVERKRLRNVRTCAADIQAPQSPVVADASSASDSGTSDDEDALPRQKARGEASTPAPTAFAAGVRFAALSAPGPSGLRAEHLRAFGMSRVARSRQAYEDAMRAFVATAIRGELPVASCWWLTDSSLTFARKPGAAEDAAPRPLRVGETLRRYVAKRIASAERAHMQRVFARRRQFGVACPGGAESLIHYRLLTRELFASHAGSHVGEWDNDFKNCYGSIYWHAIDQSVARHVRGALPWTRWCHSDRVRVLVRGGVHMTHRGAEQGDPLGPMYAAAVIADVCEAASQHALHARGTLSDLSFTPFLQAIDAMRSRIAIAASCDVMPALSAHNRQLAAAVAAAPTAQMDAWNRSCAAIPMDASLPLRRFDVWYLDDSFVRGSLVDGDLWLAALDAVGTIAGMERSTTKSFFRASPSAPTPPYTLLTCAVHAWVEPVKFLGVSLADPAAQLAAKSAEVATLHAALRGIEDPAIELILIRECVEVNRVAHLLRAIGPALPEPEPPDPPDPPPPPPSRELCPGFQAPHLDAFDELMRNAVAAVTRSVVSDEAAQQASWGVKAGGLGLRPASSVALPAHVASLVESQPFVEWLAGQSEAMHVPCSSATVSHAARCRAAAAAILKHPDSTSTLASSLSTAMEEAAAAAQKLANSILAEPGPAPPSAPSRPAYTRGSTPALIPDVGEGDPENKGSKTHGPRLQHELLGHIDAARVKVILAGLGEQRDPQAICRHRRLTDLASDTTDHSWLWAINPAHGFVLSPDSFLSALRLRLGLPVATFAEQLPCGECKAYFCAADLGTHALLCARGQRAIGHNRIRDHLAALARVSDAATVTEAAWTTSSSSSPIDGRRPADILTSAAPFGGVGSAALDVGITAPFTGDALRSAAVDPLDEYRTRKHHDYDALCRAARWDYKPLILSAFGRAHSDTRSTIHKLCVAAAKAFGGGDVARTEAAWWRNATTLLMERNARMVERCLPTILLPPALGGADEGRWGTVPPRARRGAASAEALVSGAVAPRLPTGE
jgi:hypothetical protein